MNHFVQNNLKSTKTLEDRIKREKLEKLILSL